MIRILTSNLPPVCRLLLPVRERKYRATSPLSVKQGPPRPKVNEDDLEESFLKGSGPGGQKINKTSSAVQLKHKPTGIVVKCQETRSKSQNRKIARQVLAEKVEYLEKGSESRVAIKAEIERRKKACKSKKSRRKYKAIGEAQDHTTKDKPDE